MKASKKLLALLLALVMVLALAAPAMAAEEDIMPISETGESYTVPADVAGKVVILHTNDVHGGIEGYAKVAALKKQFTDAGATVLVMDAGDFSQGASSVNVSQGATAVELMNMVGYDVAAPGNHEFDFGYENLKKLEEAASFPILAANVKYNGDAAFGDHVVLTAGEKKIGVFGLDTPETATKAHPAKIKGVTFIGSDEMYQIAQAEVDALKAEGCDYIICLGHLGIDKETAIERNRSIDMLNQVTGIDVMIDGHSHSTLEAVQEATDGTGKVGETFLTSTGTKLANVGVVILGGETITIESVPAEKIPLAEDDAIAVRAAAIQKEIDDAYGVVFAKSEVSLNGDRAPGNRTEETNLGDLICDAMLWFATKDGPLDVDADHVVALTNGGGIRAAIGIGDITKKDVNTVLPFGNTVAIVYVTGAELLEALEASTYSTPAAVGGFPQVSGFQFTINTFHAFDQGDLYPGSTYHKPNSIQRVTINSVNGKAFDPEAKYAVVSNDFCAGGGDTYYAFSVATVMDTGTPLDEALMEYITTELKGVVGVKYAEPAGNITVISNPFSDVASTDWFAPYVGYAYTSGLMKGDSATTFAPNAEVARAQVLQILYNMEGQPAVENVLDSVKDQWYANAVSWAVSEGLADTEGLAEVEGAILRSDVAAIMARYFAKKDLSINGLFVGDQNGSLNLDTTLHRSEMAVILSRIPSLKGIGGEAVSGKAAAISKYGNVGTDIKMDALTAAGFAVGDILKVEITGQEPIEIPFGTGYSNVDQGSALALADTQSNTLALAINRGDFATAYGLGVKGDDAVYTITEGVTVTVSIAEKGGYLAEMEIRNIDSKRTNVREDYASDEVFANFREVVMGDIAEGVLFRTSSPVNPELGRSTYADKLLEAAGVKTVVNLADSQEAMEGYEGYGDSYYAGLNVIPLNMGVDMYAEDAKQNLKAAFEFMIANEGPYAFHCTEGKDRAGYFAMVLEALMGGTKDEIVADYMLSFENYYHVEKDSEQWTRLAQSNILKDLMKLAGVETEAELDGADLAKAAEDYLTGTVGLTAEQVASLKGVLSAPVSGEEAKAA